MAAATAAIPAGLSEPRVPYAGVATRAVALAMDIAIVHVLVLVGAGLLGLVASLVGDLRPTWLVATITPPWRVTRCWTIARPSPVPGCVRAWSRV